MYSVWGFIISFLFALMALGLGTAALWYFFRTQEVWPSWTRALLLVTFVCSFLGVFSLFFQKGLPRKLKQVEPDLPVSRKQKLKIVHAVLFLSILLAWFSIYTYKVVKNRKSVSVSSIQIKRIELSQIEDNLLVTVVVLGQQKGGFVLTVDAQTIEYTKEKLLSISQNILLLTDKQRFHFMIPFKDIKEKYHTLLENYIPRFSGVMTVEELLQLDISLKRLVYTPSSDSNVAADIIHNLSVLAEFSFSCDEKACNILQEDRTPSAQVEAE